MTASRVDFQVVAETPNARAIAITVNGYKIGIYERTPAGKLALGDDLATEVYERLEGPRGSQ